MTAPARLEILVEEFSAERALRLLVPRIVPGVEFELRSSKYFPGGLRKSLAAEQIASHMDVENNRSRSFQVFRDGLRRLVSGSDDATAD